MIRIGDFAKIFAISIKTVRYYESMGLITPKYIDIYTGYRYYDEANIKRMQEILALKKLGFSLEEIHNFKEEDILKKIDSLEKEVSNIKATLTLLKEFSQKGKSVLEVENFINDEKAIGKWELQGIAETMTKAKSKEYMEDDYQIKELYLLPKGENYWIISWTKGIIYLNGVANNYEIDNNFMYVTINDSIDSNNSKVAVYQNINHNYYNVEDIKHKDDTNFTYVKDDSLVGFWHSVDFVHNPLGFNPNTKETTNLSLEKLNFRSNGEVQIGYKDNNYMRFSKYTKDYIADLILPDTLSHYFYKTINNHQYLFIEWKSGDYVYGGFISGYYVLEKED